MVFIQLLILHGMVDITDDVKELLKYTDLVLLDIKHIDSDKSKKLVGFGNEKELNQIIIDIFNIENEDDILKYIH